MGGRGSSSGMGGARSFREFNDSGESDDALGYGNGGITDKWVKSLTEKEREAIDEYSGIEYGSINDALRAEDETYIEDPYYGGFIKNLESAIDKFELDKPTTFIRGSTADMLGGAETVEEINAMAGKIVYDKAYMSSSTLSDSAHNRDITYRIQTPAGKGIGAYIKPISRFESENEFLFNKGSMFKVKGAYVGDRKKIYCDLEYVGRI